MRRVFKVIGGGAVASSVSVIAYANYSFAPSRESTERRLRRFAGDANAKSSSIEGMSRFTRATLTCLVCAYEYDTLFKRLDRGEYESKTSEAYLRDLDELHWKCAKRTLDLCRSLGGIYVKMGQYVATLSPIVPEPYVSFFLSFYITHTHTHTHNVTDGQKHLKHFKTKHNQDPFMRFPIF